jgi:hypothetical protein
MLQIKDLKVVSCLFFFLIDLYRLVTDIPEATDARFGG